MSASVVDNAVERCLLLSHEIGPPKSWNKIPVVDLRAARSMDLKVGAEIV